MLERPTGSSVCNVVLLAVVPVRHLVDQVYKRHPLRSGFSPQIPPTTHAPILRIVSTSLAGLQSAVDSRPLNNIPRQTIVVRVFVSETDVTSALIPPDPLHKLTGGDGAAVVLISPAPLMAQGGFYQGQMDPRFGFFVVADPSQTQSANQIVADCDDGTASTSGTGKVTPYGDPLYPIDLGARVIGCPDGDVEAICLTDVPLRLRVGALQRIYADIRTCGVPASSGQSPPTPQSGWSLASDPLLARIGAEPLCHNDGGCVPGPDGSLRYCIDGVCCDQLCGGGDPNDCQACSLLAGASGDGVCTALSWGTGCGWLTGSAVCIVQPTCQGAGAQCGFVDWDGDGEADACDPNDDRDGDGLDGLLDPDDRDPNTFIGAVEICDGRDNNGVNGIDEGTGCEVCP